MTKTTTKKYRVRGYCSFAKVFNKGVFPGSGPDEYGGKTFWKLSLHPDDNTIEKMKAAGVQTKLKDENEKSGVPGKFFTFRRPTSAQINGEEKEFSAPNVTFPDGEPVAQPIGNGSLVEVGLTVYQTKSFGKGVRLDWVTVHDLIEYSPDSDYEDLSDDEVQETSGNDAPVKGEAPWE